MSGTIFCQAGLVLAAVLISLNEVMVIVLITAVIVFVAARKRR